MKTSELKKWLEDNKWEYNETAHYIEVLDLIKVFTESQVVKFNEYFYSNEKSLELIKVVIEYTNTPISEREDEKKYNLKYNDTFFDFMDLWLVQESDGKFWFSVFRKEKFTQQEIDNFPAEIKGAIDCGFLRKAEVK